MKQEQTQTLDLALEALERIAQHEKECGERWGEATAELRQLKRNDSFPCSKVGASCLACCYCCSNGVSFCDNNSIDIREKIWDCKIYLTY